MSNYPHSINIKTKSISKVIKIGFAFLSILAFSSGTAIASTLETTNFKVKIRINCEEGVIGCDRVSYEGKDKSTGKSIKLSGKQIVRFCADGVTPCQSLGYQFKNGEFIYFVSDDGRLTVSQGKKILVNELGKWLN
jgi:hypothetical protein